MYCLNFITNISKCIYSHVTENDGVEIIGGGTLTSCDSHIVCDLSNMILFISADIRINGPNGRIGIKIPHNLGIDLPNFTQPFAVCMLQSKSTGVNSTTITDSYTISHNVDIDPAYFRLGMYNYVGLTPATNHNMAITGHITLPISNWNNV